MSSMDSKSVELLDGVDTPTPSQESFFMNEDSTNTILNNESDKMKTLMGPTANLSDIKRIIDANARSCSGELTISLDTGAVIDKLPNKKRIRNRSTKQRNDAKKDGKSSVNPHDRVKDDILLSGSPSKRSREQGGTPPSANQVAKKLSSVKSDTPNIVAKRHGNDGPNKVSSAPAAGRNDQSSGSGLSRRQKRKLKQQKADSGLKSNVAETPMIEQSQSIGSAASDKNSNQQNVPQGTQQHVEPGDKVDEGESSYANVVKGHCLAIIDQRKPGQMQLLTQERVNKLTSLLTDIMLTSDDTNAELPVFENTRLHSGAMRLQCANDYTRKWLETNVPLLNSGNNLWSGAKLILMDFKDIPKPHKFNVVFRNVNKNPKDIFTLLERQNKDIITTSWTVLSNVKRGNDTHMTIGVGQDSFDILRERSNTLFCGMGKAIFKIVKNCKENKNMLHSGAVERSSSTTATVTPTNQQIQNQSTRVEERMETNESDAGLQPQDDVLKDIQ